MIANVTFKVAAMYASTVKLGAQYHNLDEINTVNVITLTLMGLLQIPNFGVQLALLDNRQHGPEKIQQNENDDTDVKSDNDINQNTFCAKSTTCCKSMFDMFASTFTPSESSAHNHNARINTVEHAI